MRAWLIMVMGVTVASSAHAWGSKAAKELSPIRATKVNQLQRLQRMQPPGPFRLIHERWSAKARARIPVERPWVKSAASALRGLVKGEIWNRTEARDPRLRRLAKAVNVEGATGDMRDTSKLVDHYGVVLQPLGNKRFLVLLEDGRFEVAHVAYMQQGKPRYWGTDGKIPKADVADIDLDNVGTTLRAATAAMSNPTMAERLLISGRPLTILRIHTFSHAGY